MGLAERPDARERVVSEGSASGRPPRAWLAFAVISLAAAIAYAPSFAVPFQFDDEARLLHNDAMQEGGPLWDALRWLGNSRVVPSMTFVLNYQLGGLEPIGYHIVNFAVHLLTTLGVFALALTLCRTPRLRAAWPPRRALLLATRGRCGVRVPSAADAGGDVHHSALCLDGGALLRMGRRLFPARPPPPTACGAGSAAALLRCHYRAGGVCGAVEGARGQPAGRAVAGRVGRLRTTAAVARAGGRRAGDAGDSRCPGGVEGAHLAAGHEIRVGGRHPAVDARARLPFSRRAIPCCVAARPGPVAYLFTQATVLPRYLGLVVLPSGLNVDHDVPFARGVVAVGAGRVRIPRRAGARSACGCYRASRWLPSAFSGSSSR